MLTLTGPAGIGKTRLAIQAALRLGDHFANVVFISLGEVSEHSLVLPVIAQALGLREEGEHAADARLRAYLAEQELLLILDNFEQVGRAAPEIARLLTACPRVKTLVTSRVPLRVRGEHEFAVPPLDIPDLARLPALEHLIKYSAVELFLRRAQAIRPTFAVTPDLAPTIAAICARLDGLPLALELAAARLKLLSPQMVLARLDTSLALLTQGATDLPKRQQTMRRAISWSYELLDEPEQRLFRQLAVFTGGWTLEMAEVICSDGVDVLDSLSALVDNSLVIEEISGDEEPRFRLLQLIREYAWEQLDAAGESDALHWRHADYFATAAENAAQRLYGRESVSGYTFLIRELDNFRAAMTWAREASEVSAGLRIAASLWRTWYLIGRSREGYTWLENLLRRDDLAGQRQAPSAVRAAALVAAASLAAVHIDPDQAFPRAEEALSLYRCKHDWGGVATATNLLGLISEQQGDQEQEVRLYTEALSIRRELGDLWGIAIGLSNLAEGAQRRGECERARLLFRECLLNFRESGEQGGIALALAHLGDVARAQGQLRQARDLYQTSLNIRWMIVRQMANDAVYIGEISSGLRMLAGVAVEQDLPARAARLFGAGARLQEIIGLPLVGELRRIYDRDVADARQSLGDETFAREWAEGLALSLQEAMELAIGSEGKYAQDLETALAEIERPG
jgi:predicted ATPase